MATITEARPTTSDKRVPYMIELSTSRPWSSVPSGKIQSPSPDTNTGGLSPSLRLSVEGSNGVGGASAGERNATATIMSGATTPATASEKDLKVPQISLSDAGRQQAVITVPADACGAA